MKRIFRNLSLAIILVFIGGNLSSCVSKDQLNKLQGIFNLNEGYVIFDDTKVDKEEINKYESPYKDASANYFKEQLGDEEKTLYQSLIYAYEKEYTTIKYFSDDVKLGDSIQKIIQSLCAENPFFDWNYAYECTYDPLEGCYIIKSPSLDKKEGKLKIEAYNKAKEIIATMPNGLSDEKKLRWIYDYVVTNIKYVSDLDGYMKKIPPYVYDGLVKGETQCTGYTSSIMMLSNMVGIETLSVSGNTTQGHAWNLVKLNGKYYHCDSTGDSAIISSLPENRDKIWLNFLKSDERIFSTDYSLSKEVVITFPKATDTQYDEANIAVSCDTVTNEVDLNKMAEALVNNKDYIIVHLPEISAKENFDVQQIVDYVGNYASNNMTFDRNVYISLQGLRSPQTRDIILFMDIE